ncbi:MAG: B12-binding domain-containing radical SAM protein [Spirochaetes bacterium]|nr:B12-binding domain-containing radical SAM protein [Spirochaetota bacterium]
MRIILINPSYFTPDEAALQWEKYKENVRGGNMYYYPFEPPMGLASLYSSLKKNGHEVKIIDMQGDRLSDAELRKKLSAESPQIIGITAMTPMINTALRIAVLAKFVHPSIPVIMGGVHPTVSPVSVLSNDCVDFVVRGEGEFVLEKFFRQGIDNPENIQGLCWKQKDGNPVITEKAAIIDDIDSLPYPDYSSFPVENYIDYTRNLRGIRGITMMVTRGCPYRCSFCAVKETMGTRWRRLDPANAAKWMMEICGRYNLEGIWFKDSTFNLNRGWTRSFAEALITNKNRYQFQINTRVDLIREDEIILMKKAGLVQVDLGIESGSPKILKILRKEISIKEIYSSVDLLRKHGIKVSGFFMIGVPGETEADIAETLKLARNLNLDRGSVSIFTPLPGSELYDILAGEGRIDVRPESFEYHHFTEARESYCEVPIERLRQLHDEIDGYFAKSC